MIFATAAALVNAPQANVAFSKTGNYGNANNRPVAVATLPPRNSLKILQQVKRRYRLLQIAIINVLMR